MSFADLSWLEVDKIKTLQNGSCTAKHKMYNFKWGSIKVKGSSNFKEMN